MAQLNLEKKKVRATGVVGLVLLKTKEGEVNYYHLIDAEADKLDVYMPLGIFKIEELDYTDEQKESMWNEHEEHSRQVQEQNHYHYYNR